MRLKVISLAAVSLLVASACGEEAGVSHTAPASGPTPTPSTLQESASNLLSTMGEPYASANLNNGEQVWRSCRSCHTLPDGARHSIGPNLYGLFDRRVGAADGFRYSSALTEADFIWTPEQLDEWLADPRGFLPGNRMSFAGLRQAEDRRDVIAYLAVETSAATPPAP